MADLRDKVENALNETRMLILGSQVLLGFQYRGVFEPGFTRLPQSTQELKLVGLGLMVLAVGLLIAPGAFHQIVLRGHDSTRVAAFTGRIATLALLPFALGIGIDLYVATSSTIEPYAIAIGVGGAAAALFMWYGLEWFVRLKGGTPADQKETTVETDLSTRIKQVLTEARVVLPGAQALLGFQFAAVLTDEFGKLPKSSQYVHLLCLALIAVSIMCLMAPAAFHRIVERGEDTERIHTFASTMVLTAMVPLGLGIAGDFYVVLKKVLQSDSLALLIAGVAVAFCYGLWFGLTTAVRSRQAAPQSVVTRPAR